MLKKEGIKIYNDFKSYLERHSTFDTADDYILTELAFYFQVWFESAREISKDGYKTIYSNKSEGQSASFKVMTECSKHIAAICHKIGIYEVMKVKFHEYGKITEESDKWTK